MFNNFQKWRQKNHFIMFYLQQPDCGKSDSVCFNCNKTVSRPAQHVTENWLETAESSRQLQWPRKCPFLVFLLEHGDWESTKKDGSLTDYWSPSLPWLLIVNLFLLQQTICNYFTLNTTADICPSANIISLWDFLVSLTVELTVQVLASIYDLFVRKKIS